MPKYYGKYRAIVVDVKDPEERGRIKVQCPKVLGDAKSAWYQPCVPYAYEKGGDFVLPELNDFVWIEFEDGDVRYPIYTGGLWSKSNSPISDYSQAPDVRQIEFAGCKITMKKGEVIITNGSAQIRLVDGDIHLN